MKVKKKFVSFVEIFTLNNEKNNSDFKIIL